MRDHASETIVIRCDGGTPVLVFPPEVDFSNADLVRTRGLWLLNQGARRIVLDLTYCRFCDSTGVDAIFRCHIRARALGAELKLRLPPTGLVRRICAITGVLRVVPLDEVPSPQPQPEPEPQPPAPGDA